MTLTPFSVAYMNLLPALCGVTRSRQEWKGTLLSSLGIASLFPWFTSGHLFQKPHDYSTHPVSSLTFWAVLSPSLSQELFE